MLRILYRQMNVDKFCEWFEGKFDNWKQASSNPSSWAHIYLIHERIDERKFLTSSRYNFSQEPYREQEVTVVSENGLLIVKNPICDMFFNFSEDHFAGQSRGGCTYKDQPFSSDAKLFENEYHTWDRGYWQSSNGFFIFEKRL